MAAAAALAVVAAVITAVAAVSTEEAVASTAADGPEVDTPAEDSTAVASMAAPDPIWAAAGITDPVITAAVAVAAAAA